MRALMRGSIVLANLAATRSRPAFAVTAKRRADIAGRGIEERSLNARRSTGEFKLKTCLQTAPGRPL